MSGIDIFAWIVVLIAVATVGIVFAVLGMLPGKVARQRGHPQVEAIGIASWLALIFGFALWPVVLVWAYLRPIARPLDTGGEAQGDSPAAAAQARVAELEARIAELEAAAGPAAPEGGPA